MGADRLLVMANGRLAQPGSHAELVAREGAYKALWEKQHGFALDAAHHRAEISIDRLRLVPVFYAIADHVLAEATHRFRTEECPANHVVLREGEFGACLYIIVRGIVELLKTSADGVATRTLVLEDGDCFGERALLESMPEHESARTLTPCVFLTLNRAEYLSMQQPPV